MLLKTKDLSRDGPMGRLPETRHWRVPMSPPRRPRLPAKKLRFRLPCCMQLDNQNSRDEPSMLWKRKDRCRGGSAGRLAETRHRRVPMSPPRRPGLPAKKIRFRLHAVCSLTIKTRGTKPECCRKQRIEVETARWAVSRRHAIGASLRSLLGGPGHRPKR